jgi:hypothetical protein
MSRRNYSLCGGNRAQAAPSSLCNRGLRFSDALIVHVATAALACPAAQVYRGASRITSVVNPQRSQRKFHRPM